jgi:hypothetical protein
VAPDTANCSRITDIDEIKNQLVVEWGSVKYSVVATEVDDWQHRLNACVLAGDGHFEH